MTSTAADDGAPDKELQPAEGPDLQEGLEPGWRVPVWWDDYPAGPGGWVRRAACGTVGGNWFPDGAIDLSWEREVCAACPVQQDCLAYALEAGVEYGIWGGYTATERADLQQQQPQPRSGRDRAAA